MSFNYKLFLLLSFFIFYFDWVCDASFVNAASQTNPPEFDIPKENLSHSGFIQLKWNVENDAIDSGVRFEVQQSNDSDFSECAAVYTGPDFATYLSGLKNGNYYFRVRTVGDGGTPLSPWSDRAALTVEHHSQTLTYLLLCVGGLVFLCTVAVVVHGSLGDRS